MNFKRITIICGHYGSGKTNIAVNLAKLLKNEKNKVAVADLDIVNPYFRTKDSEKDLENSGISLICSDYANSNLDIPALPDNLYSIVDDKSTSFILDIGGDDRGAYVLGRIAPAITEENNYQMLMVINAYRPLTPDAESTVEVLKEIETAAKIKFTGLINNSNIGNETTANDVVNSFTYAEEISKITNLPIVATTVTEDIYNELKTKYNNLIQLKLQEKLF